MENNFVAIESTNDYTDAKFHKDIIDINVRNSDGSYGKVADYYRIVGINEDGRVQPIDNKVFKSLGEARLAVASNPALKEISYDSIINKAADILMEKAYIKHVKPWTPELPKNSKTIDLGMDR